MSKASELFRKNLRLAMEANGVTQGQLASLSGINQPQISVLLNSKHDPRLDTVEKVANALGFEAWEMTREDPPNIDTTLSSTQREVVFLVSSMKDQELEPFLTMLRAWPGHRKPGLNGSKQKKKA